MYGKWDFKNCDLEVTKNAAHCASMQNGGRYCVLKVVNSPLDGSSFYYVADEPACQIFEEYVCTFDQGKPID